MNAFLTILIVHNHYQQRGGEDSVFETECKMLEDAGHTVIRYTKHNEEIKRSSELRVASSERSCESRVASCELRSASAKGNVGYGVSPSETTPYSLLPTPSTKPPCLRGEKATHSLLRFFVFFVAKFHHLRRNLSLFRKTIWNSQSYREITEIIQQHHPDIVHCHNTFPLISPSAYWAARKQGVPVVQTLHNYRLTCLNGYLFRDKHICELCLGRAPIPGIIRKCYRDSFAASFTVATMLIIHRALGTYRNKVTTYIALTEFARQKFITAGLPADKIVVKPNAIALSSSAVATEDSSESRVASCELRRDSTAEEQETSQETDKAHDKGLEKAPPHDTPDSPNGDWARAPAETTPYSLLPAPSEHGGGVPPTVLYVGRLSPEKGVDVLIRAWALCNDKLPIGSQLHIIGDGPERPALEALGNGIPYIKVLGSIPHANIASHMHSATVLVMPSIWYEQFAITPLEAMIQETPVIVSDCSKHSTIIENNKSGFVFKAGDPDSLSDVIIMALSNTNRLHTMATNAQIAVTASLCMCDKNIQSLYDIYTRKCDKR